LVHIKPRKIQKTEIEAINKHLEFLTSESAGSRLAGSIGAKKTASYLADELRKIGYFPKGIDDYFTYVEIHNSYLESPANLSVGSRILEHRVEFGEVVKFLSANGGTYEGELFIVNDGEEVDQDVLRGKVVLIPNRPEGFDLGATLEGAKALGVVAVLYESGEPKWFVKGIQPATNEIIPAIRVRASIVEELKDMVGEVVKISLPVITQKTACNNVIGFIPGVNSEETVLLTAHYDHLGDDPFGKRYPGAVDNASGVSVMLEIAKQLSEKRNELPFNIIVAFLTGEEIGLRGAKNLVDNPPLPISAVINLDSIGFEPALNAMRTGHKESGHWLADISAEVISDFGVDVRWIAGGEDSMAFQAAGIAAVGLGQKPTEPKQRGIHSPEDNIENLYHEPIYLAYEIVTELINRLMKNSEVLKK
jgi:aminopeptidase YwaD